jgi:hypothetical protein
MLNVAQSCTKERGCQKSDKMSNMCYNVDMIKGPEKPISCTAAMRPGRKDWRQKTGSHPTTKKDHQEPGALSPEISEATNTPVNQNGKVKDQKRVSIFTPIVIPCIIL